ncbi:MAG: hypothetical protein QCH35_09515 [Methanomicrobiaceae archaeon]|nr:hypothetical protein [Methanomicrobiaceae archaeon]
MRKGLYISFIALAVLALTGTASAYDPLGLNLPDDPVTLRITSLGGDAYINVQLSNIDAGYDIENGEYPGWCADADDFIYYPVDYNSCTLFSSYDDAVPNYVAVDDWDRINYIVNQFRDGEYPDATYQEVQAAIWYFTPRDHEVSQYVADAGWTINEGIYQDIVDDADTNGDGFFPGYNDVVGIVCDNGQCVQVVFVELIFTPVPEFPVLAVPVGLLVGMVGVVAMVKGRESGQS